MVYTYMVWDTGTSDAFLADFDETAWFAGVWSRGDL